MFIWGDQSEKTACGWRIRAAIWKSRTLSALHCTSVLTAYLPTGVIDLKIRRKSVYASVWGFIKGALRKQPAESSVLENTVVTLSAYLCLCLCAFLHYASIMLCMLGFWPVYNTIAVYDCAENEQETLGDQWALRNHLPVGGHTKEIQYSRERLHVSFRFQPMEREITLALSSVQHPLLTSFPTGCASKCPVCLLITLFTGQLRHIWHS